MNVAPAPHPWTPEAPIGGAAGSPPDGELCPLCGGSLARAQDWCLRCGAAARTRLAASPRWKTPMIVLAVVAALALAVLAAALVKLAGGSDSSAKPAAGRVLTAPAAPSAQGAGASAANPGTSAVSPSTAPPAATAPAGAGSTPPAAPASGATAPANTLAPTTGGTGAVTPGTRTTPGARGSGTPAARAGR